MRMKPVLTLDDAKKLLAAAEEEAGRNGWEVVIRRSLTIGGSIRGPSSDGRRQAGQRSDRDCRKGKHLQAMTCRPSRVWEKWVDGPHKAYATFPFIAAQGGLPIIIDGELIGAIGVSGVKAFEDEQIAMFAVKTVFPGATTARAGEENDA